MQELLRAVDNLAAAAIDADLKQTQRAKANKEMVETFPERDVRGSRDWWAARCRTNTGSHFLDSGGAYGYKYEQPVLSEPLYYDIHQGGLYSVFINTVDFLYETLDASDEVAAAMEEILYWIGDNVDANRTWSGTMDIFPDMLGELLLMDRDDEEYLADVQMALERHGASHYPDSLGWKRVDGLPEDWQDTFPWDSLLTVTEAGCVGEAYLGGYNTYNGDCDLDQTLQFDTLKVGPAFYIMLQIHCGCDVRGGYTRPVVARMRDYEYFYSFTADLCCGHCDTHWELYYFYNDDLKELEEAAVQVERDGEWIDADEDSSGLIPYDRARLYCPHCAHYSVHAYNVVLGF